MPSPGQAWFYAGSATGFATMPTRTILPGPGLTNFGAGVAGAGDVTGAGYSGFVVSAQTSDSAGTGDAVPYLGGSSGPDLAHPIVLPPSSAPECCGVAASAGDVNGDGLPDLVYGTSDPGVSIYVGDVAQGVRRFGGLAPAQEPFAPALDVDSDGFDDVLVTNATPPMLPSTPSMFTGVLFRGGAASAAAVWTSPSTDDAGLAFAAGDYNGDGFADVAVGVPRLDEVLVFSGSASGLSTRPSQVVSGPAGMSFGELLAN